MKIASILENLNIEKRISVTPEIVKKYISLGFEVLSSENYGSHLGITDKEFSDLGAKILNDNNEIIKKADLVVQLGILSDEKISLMKENHYLNLLFERH